MLEQELKGARSAITDKAAGIGTAIAHLLAYLIRDARSRCFFKHFLVTTLHRAITVSEDHDIALSIGKHLELHMARFFQVALHINRIVAEGSLGFTAGKLPGVKQSSFGMHDPHALAAAAGCRFDDDRVADLGRDAHDLLSIVWQGPIRTGDARHPGFAHRFYRRDLVSH